MFIPSYRNLLNLSRLVKRCAQPVRTRKNRRARLQVEALEARWVPSYAITDLASFTGSPGGHNPLGALIEDSNGNFFGTTLNGGPNDEGTVFEWVKSSGTFTTLASFNDSNDRNGKAPLDKLVEDSSGNLFGTTNYGGDYGWGTLFEWVRSSGTLTTLVSFNANSNTGIEPVSGLLMDSSGNLFGTTTSGGARGDGTLFEWSPGTGLSILADFFAGSVSSSPQGGLVEDSSGNLFGTTSGGGTNHDGTLFEWSPGSGLTTLFSFSGNSGQHPGQYPEGNLLEDSSGNIFGTTYSGGTNNKGTVFEWAPSSGSFTSLASFDGFNGNAPDGDLAEDSSGNLFGATVAGGAFDRGTAFEWVKSTGMISTLASFDGPNSTPHGGVIRDANGNLFGTTEAGNTLFAVVKSTTWTGLGTDNNWSNSGNWTDGVPGTGQAAVFSTHAGSNTAVVDVPFYGVLSIDTHWGGTINVNQPFTTYGTDQWASGAINVAGGVTWTNTSTLTLGDPNVNHTNQSLGGLGALSNANTLIGQSTTFTDSGEYTETGTLQVRFGATAILSGTFDNYDGVGTLTGGTYDITGTLQFANAVVTTNAANLILDGSAAAITDGSNDALGPYLALNAAGGSFTVQNHANFTTAGDFENDGTLTVDSAGTFGATFTVSGNYTGTGTTSVQGAGTLTLAGGGTTSGTVIVGARLVVAAGTTFTDSGSYSETGDGAFGVPPTLQVQAGATATLSGTFSNFAGGTLTGGTYDLLGTLQFANAALVTNSANLILDGSAAAVTDLNGNDALGPSLTTNAAAGHLSFLDGAVFTTAGSFANNGILTVGAGSAFNVSGNFTQGASATLEVQLGGTGSGQSGQLAVTGLATLNGTLLLTPVNGYVPQSGDSIPVLTYGSRSGTFSTPPPGFTLNFDDIDGILTVIKQ
jgi:uncharacterized repeat protein (TIGR03803 family)